MPTKIFSFTLILLGLLIIIFFQNYKGTLIPAPELFWAGGLLLIGTGAWMVRRSMRNMAMASQQKKKRMIADLKKNGKVISVDLSKCTLRDCSYTEEAETLGDKAAMIDAIAGTEPNIVANEVVQNAVIYQPEPSGEIFVSEALPHDQATILFKMENQKLTKLYVDRHDPSKYYFDLEFLDN